MSGQPKTKKRDRKRRGFFLFLLWASAGFLIAGAVALYKASGLLQLHDPPKRADAIVVPGGNPVRAFHAARLFRDGHAPIVYVDKPALSSGDIRIRTAGIEWPREEELTTQILLKEGVPHSVIRFYGPTRSTAEEAEVLARMLTAKPCSLLVVTSPSHTRRARMIFRDALPHCVITVVGTPDEELPAAWWLSQDAARQVLLETVKIFFYKLGGRYRTGS
ncbi:MAG TPA: YdcF family protein [Dissulfurispiraceae bacterium]|nr:YdcF family protein [Dissulfurispiraceae bacterium]